MGFLPMGKRVLIKRQLVETKTNSGILLPIANKNEKPSIGVIVAISEILKKDHSNIIEGDVVAFKEYKANEIKLENEEYLIVEEEDILGRII